MRGRLGAGARRREGPAKLCGRALYVDHHPLPGALFGVTRRSTIPRGRITKLDFDAPCPSRQRKEPPMS